ncbi:MAG: hypothetical protein E7571_02945 [Ruminococcaceae bacterium]|nr:hypothetical protein [Oscillospiraceae bacterium]
MSDNENSKVKQLFTEIKTHWKKPAPGKYVPYREYGDIVLAVGNNYAGSKILEYLTFGAACMLMMYHYKLPYLSYSVINIINMPLSYIWTLIWWFVCDNLGFLPKKTEKKLYILYMCMITVGLFMIFFPFQNMLAGSSNRFVQFMNGLKGISCASAIKILGTNIMFNGWVGARNIFWRKKLIPKFGRYKYALYCDAVPKVIMVFVLGWAPYYDIGTYSEVDRVWIANLLFAVYNVFGFANNMETCTQNISPNVRERIFVRSYPIKLSHIFYSIYSMILPIIIGKLKYKWEDIAMFKYVIPISFTIFVVLTLVFAGRVKERIPQPPLEKKVQINFWDGMFGVMRNRYYWIYTVVGLLDSLGNGMLVFTTVLYLYTFRLSGATYSILVALVSFAGTPPDLFTPYFIKRFSYKQIMVFFQYSRAIGYSIIVCVYWFFGDNLMLCGIVSVIMLFIMEMFKTVPTAVNHDMEIRIKDYQMYLSGERLENFAGVFGWFTGPVTTFVSLIIPVLLLRYGFNSNYDVLFVDSVRKNIIIIPLIFDIVGYVLMSIPYMTWDYTDDKQNKVMEVLRRREEVTRKQMEEGNAEHPDSNAETAAEEKVEVMS